MYESPGTVYCDHLPQAVNIFPDNAVLIGLRCGVNVDIDIRVLPIFIMKCIANRNVFMIVIKCIDIVAGIMFKLLWKDCAGFFMPVFLRGADLLLAYCCKMALT